MLSSPPEALPPQVAIGVHSPGCGRCPGLQRCGQHQPRQEPPRENPLPSLFCPRALTFLSSWPFLTWLPLLASAMTSPTHSDPVSLLLTCSDHVHPRPPVLGLGHVWGPFLSLPCPALLRPSLPCSGPSGASLCGLPHLPLPWASRWVWPVGSHRPSPHCLTAGLVPCHRLWTGQQLCLVPVAPFPSLVPSGLGVAMAPADASAWCLVVLVAPSACPLPGWTLLCPAGRPSEARWHRLPKARATFLIRGV